MSSVWLPFSNADIGLLWLLSDFYEGYKPNQTVQDFLPFTDVTTWLKDTEQISVPFWLTELNVEQKEKSTFCPPGRLNQCKVASLWITNHPTM